MTLALNREVPTAVTVRGSSENKLEESSARTDGRRGVHSVNVFLIFI